MRRLDHGDVRRYRTRFSVVAGASAIADLEARIDAAHPQMAAGFPDASGIGGAASGPASGSVGSRSRPRAARGPAHAATGPFRARWQPGRRIVRIEAPDQSQS